MKHKATDNIFDTPEIETHIFRAGDVVRIVDIPRWRLEKFLTGKGYQLSPSGQLGKGKGSWRLFKAEDLYRLAVASRMVEDGFTAKFVSFVLQSIEDKEMFEFDEVGNVRVPELGVFRTKEGPEVRFVSSTNKPYYVVPLADVVRTVDAGIKATKEKN
jgi:hypothetical protein